MNQALSILYNIYRAFMSWVFNDFVIYSDSGHSVSFGWFMVAIFVFSILLKNLLMLPKVSQSVRLRSKEDESIGL